MKKYLLLALAVIGFAGAYAQEKPVNWNFTAKKIADKTYEVHFTANITGNWHIYSQTVGVDGPVPTTFTYTKNPLLTVEGKPKEEGKLIKKKEEAWDGVVNYFEKTVNFVQIVKVKGAAKTNLAGKVEYMVCNDEKCLPPVEVPFNVNIGG
ncbi:protein-disulfide reductase DsbD domain-containing protein [Paraflavitalea sp. CAU 1676]|uniref:protein-disulfide reductase DsbD domain-containing protein n=1 Tax=Paraflavitalea sp. CAU 1676 TaxID=3032598 RepID=UPI0023DC03EF|nr:protein-disulfide reductase DsbD domain-containing protein [Paraflavitalea sp. CAU 1676]MDF2187664.1 protein-disulfide reductase DsbD family protein [Paraflavitalea sp. CAU 1676]